MEERLEVELDVAIIGGGIAGLWALDACRGAGLEAALFERSTLGEGQTIASQGIIHGGAKYTLGLMADSSVSELREMPDVWRAALAGAKGPDLSLARVLSPCTHLWHPKRAGSSLVASFSRRVMRSRVSLLPREEWPEACHSPRGGGHVQQVDELVLDVPSVIDVLRRAHAGRVKRLPRDARIRLRSSPAELEVGDLRVRAQTLVLTSGAGNEGLLDALGIETIRTQRRPLQQVLIAGMHTPLYAHCVGRGTRPLATVTAHPADDGSYYWYVGGELAELGTRLSAEGLIAKAKQTLPSLFPGADFGPARWATHGVDRAEPATADGYKPTGPAIVRVDDVVVAWPTKLALAPALAEMLVDEIRTPGHAPVRARLDGLGRLPDAEVAKPPWVDAAWS